VKLSDAYTTGSSMMPQKKNPDMAELIRGKTGRVIGDLVNLLVTLKRLPLTYNRDLQEDKFPVFDAFDTVQSSLAVLSGMLSSAEFLETPMREALAEGYLEATEIADYLVREQNIPFRQAHRVAGEVVKYALSQSKRLSQLSVVELAAVHPGLDANLAHALGVDVMLEQRDRVGGPAKKQVALQIASLISRLDARQQGSK